MNRFFVKFYLLIAGVVFFIAGAIFLMFNHVDTLYRYVPAEAENYLHLKPASVRNLSLEQRETVTKWLAEHSSLKPDTWDKLLSLKERELGLFSLNGQIYTLLRDNRSTRNLISTEKLSNLSDRGVIFVPQLILAERGLKDSPWFKSLHQKICFKDLILYSHNLGAMQLNLPAVKNIQMPDIALLGNINDQHLNLWLLGSIGQTPTTHIENPLKVLPTSTQKYFRNLKVEEISQFNAVSSNLEFLIVQKLGGAIEYYKDSSGSQVRIAKNGFSLNQVKKAIFSSLAQIYPSRKEKTLPDNSIAINLVADETAWDMKEAATGELFLVSKDETLQASPRLDLKATVEDYTITIGTPNVQGEKESKCKIPKFSQKGLLYSKLSISGFNNLLLLNKNQKKIEICID